MKSLKFVGLAIAALVFLTALKAEKYAWEEQLYSEYASTQAIHKRLYLNKKGQCEEQEFSVIAGLEEKLLKTTPKVLSMCAPQIAALEIKKIWGSCTVSRLDTKRMPASTSQHSGVLNLNSDCLCSVEKPSLFGIGHQGAQSWYANTRDCLQLFNENQRAKVEEIYQKTYSTIK